MKEYQYKKHYIRCFIFFEGDFWLTQVRISALFITLLCYTKSNGSKLAYLLPEGTVTSYLFLLLNSSKRGSSTLRVTTKEWTVNSIKLYK